MSSLTWSDELAVHHPRMDATHQEFVTHLQQVQATLEQLHEHKREAPETPVSAELNATLLAHFDAMVAHTVEHFAQEDRWMTATGFTPDNCHSMQHRQVLELLHEVRRRFVDKHEPAWLDRLIPELIQWFIQHAQAADAALAYHMKQIGYDTETGETHHPVAASAIDGCGGSCGH